MENNTITKYKQQWKEWKQKHPGIALACPKCDKSLTIQNITKALKFRCPKCHEETLQPKRRKYDSIKGHSGKRKRDWTKLVDQKGNPYNPLDNKMILDLLNSNIPEPSLAYQSARYIRVLKQNALVALTYLLAARISEICGIKIDGKYKDIFPMKRSQVYFEIQKDKKVIVFENINILKRKQEDSYDYDGTAHKTVPKRTIKLWYDLDGELFSFVEKYLEVMDKHEKTYELFPISRQTATNYLVRVYHTYLQKKGENKEEFKSKTAYLHWLRHSRLTYLSKKFQFTDTMLRHYVGWGSSAMAQKYVHLAADDLLERMTP